MPTKNPFRNRAPSPPLPPLPHESPAAGPSSQPEISTSSTHVTPPETSSAHAIMEDVDDDDLPPPYTPAANVGEETIDMGPRRPFQPPPSRRSSPPRPPPGQSNWPPPPVPPPRPYPAGPNPGSGYYMQPRPQLGLAPWQTSQQYRQRQNGGLIGALFDTVRDIADSVSGVRDERVMAQSVNSAMYAAPYAGSHATYGPLGQVQQPYPPRPASTPPQVPSSTVPDDGSPTRTPVPGHPLLRDGHLLVYPKDHTCDKCGNTGYKDYNPSHPCRKCWEKYGKPYTGALSYTPWSPSGNDPRMQRPLPRPVLPHLTGSSPSGSGLHRGPFPQTPQHHNRSVSHPHHTGSGPSYYVVSPFSSDFRPPVPHAIPVNPGDPRLGGWLCTGCGGDGYRTVMFIDVVMCDNCGGTGRVWM